METIVRALETIFRALCDSFYHAFGDPSDSQGGDVAMAIGVIDWIPLVTMNYPCILYLRNTSVDAALLQELQFSWNKRDIIGGRIAYGGGVIFDRVQGTVYVKPGDPTKTAAANFSAVSLKHSSQNI